MNTNSNATTLPVLGILSVALAAGMAHSASAAGETSQQHSAHAASPLYRIVDLGTLPGDSWSEAKGINDKGQIICSSGNHRPNDPTIYDVKAFVWEKGRRRDIGTLPKFPIYEGIAINSEGWVLAHASQNNHYSSPHRTFLWKNGIIRDVRLPRMYGITPNALSDLGDIVGEASLSKSSSSHPFVWSERRSAFLTLPASGSAWNINHGVSGHPYYIVGGSKGNPFIWRNGKMFNVPLAKSWGGNFVSVNAHGQAVGLTNLTSGHSHAILWQFGHTTDLGLLPQKTSDSKQHATLAASTSQNSYAKSINDKGLIVGWATLAPENDMHAVCWRNGQIQDLNDAVVDNLGVTLEMAVGVNDLDEIICNGYKANALSNENQHAYLLVPIGTGPYHLKSRHSETNP